MLLLFDIDATLLKTSGAGMRAMEEVARNLFGPNANTDAVDYGGGLDPLIMVDIMQRSGVEPTAERLRAYREGYAESLTTRLRTPGIGQALPGVHALLARLHRRKDVTLGLLTGNYPETGRAKLRACEIDPDQFQVTTWGDDSPHTPPARWHLPPVAMQRFTKRFERPITPDRVVIIGDTPRDVHCARTNDCWVLGVATGSHPLAELTACGAHHAVADLSDTATIEAWLVDRP